MARRDETLTFMSRERGKMRLRMIDRINVDDLVLHLTHRETFRLRSGIDEGVDVASTIKDFLLTNRFSSGR